MELTGELAQEAQEALNDLHKGIDSGKNIVTSTHNFEIKLHAVDTALGHIHMNFMDAEDLVAFTFDIADEIIELREDIAQLEKEEIHIIKLEETLFNLVL